jgi:hypothetical protein
VLSVGDLETDLTDSEHKLNTSNFSHSWGSSRTRSWVHPRILSASHSMSSSYFYIYHTWTNHLDF